MIGRAIDGVRVIGPTDHLEPVVNEFAEHGVRINHVIVGGDPDMLSKTTLPEIRRICEAHQIRLDFVPELIGLQRLQPAEPEAGTGSSQRRPQSQSGAGRYHRILRLKEFLDVVATVTCSSFFYRLFGYWSAWSHFGRGVTRFLLAATLGPRWPTLPASETSDVTTTIRLARPQGTG